MPENDPDYIVFFDGVCSLCNGFVRFLFKRDRDEQIYVAPLEGETAQKHLPEALHGDDVDSIIFMDASGSAPEFYQKSEAVLRIAPLLGGIWKLTAGFRYIPRILRDPLYDFIASHRYEWFGKYDACPTPEPGWKERFLP